MKQYSLKFINKGKAFSMPPWTIGKHKAALAQMNTECAGMSDEEKTDEFNFYVIYQTLKQIDSTVTIDNLRELHPENLVQLFTEVYNAGKSDIFLVQNPKKGKGKSTGKKN